jgi:hypothetical protein
MLAMQDGFMSKSGWSCGPCGRGRACRSRAGHCRHNRCVMFINGSKVIFLSIEDYHRKQGNGAEDHLKKIRLFKRFCR